MCPSFLDEKEKQNIKMYDFTMEFLIKQLDITSYMSLLSHFEKQQLINFNESQKHSFNCFKRPNLNSIPEMEIF